MPDELIVDVECVLRVLARHGVRFIVVGGVAGVLHGAAINTFDVDVVHSRSAENIAKLLAALDDLDAIYRLQPERKLRPAASHLAAPGRQLLMTRYGPLDLLGEIANKQGYDDLLEDPVEFEVASNLRVHDLGLRKLIEVKKATGRDKDLKPVAILERLLIESERV